MKRRTQLDLCFAMLDLLAGSRSGGQQLKAGFLAELLPTLPLESRSKLNEEISENYYQFHVKAFRREMPAFQN